MWMTFLQRWYLLLSLCGTSHPFVFFRVCVPSCFCNSSGIWNENSKFLLQDQLIWDRSRFFFTSRHSSVQVFNTMVVALYWTGIWAVQSSPDFSSYSRCVAIAVSSFAFDRNCWSELLNFAVFSQEDQKLVCELNIKVGFSQNGDSGLLERKLYVSMCWAPFHNDGKGKFGFFCS